MVSRKIRRRNIRIVAGIAILCFIFLSGTSGASPPPAILEIDGNEQTSGIGDYCWKEENQTSGLCADSKGKITPAEPLLTTSPFTALLRLPLQEPPEELEFRTFRVTDDDESKGFTDGVRVWILKGNALNRYKRPFEREPEFNLSLPPGLYILNGFAKWEGKGDVSYGFLVQVNDPAPNVTIQVSAAAIDSVEKISWNLNFPLYFNITSNPSGADVYIAKYSPELCGPAPHKPGLDLIGKTPLTYKYEYNETFLPLSGLFALFSFSSTGFEGESRCINIYGSENSEMSVNIVQEGYFEPVPRTNLTYNIIAKLKPSGKINKEVGFEIYLAITALLMAITMTRNRN